MQSIEYFARARSIFSKLDIWIPRLPGPSIQVQSIEYFAHARSIFWKLDIWTPRYVGAKY